MTDTPPPSSVIAECPFCGSNELRAVAKRVRVSAGRVKQFVGSCGLCGSSGPIYGDAETALVAFTTRSPKITAALALAEAYFAHADFEQQSPVSSHRLRKNLREAEAAYRAVLDASAGKVGG